MARKALSLAKLKQLKRRFRAMVDFSFNGNLTFAADTLEMPFSTVQQYYQRGPRRIDGRAVKRIDDLLGRPGWIIGEEDPPMGDTLGGHIIDGQFQSDKYPDCPRGLVPFKVTDRMAQDLLWEYANRRRSIDEAFADDLQRLLLDAGYDSGTTYRPSLLKEAH